MSSSTMDAPTPGPIAVGDHISWGVALQASYQDGRDPAPTGGGSGRAARPARACGEVTGLMHSGDGSGLLAHTTVHDRLHRPTDVVEAVPVRRLRREPSVTQPTTEVGIGGAPVREAVGGISGWAVPVRETTGGVVRSQPTVHEKKQETRPMSADTQTTTTAQGRDMTQGNSGAESGFAPGDHASWSTHGDTTSLLGGDPVLQKNTLGQRDCGEIISLGWDSGFTVAFIDQHTLFHQPTGAQACVRVDQLRREKPVNSPLVFVSGNPTPIREAQGMAPYDNLLGTVREAAGDLAPEALLGTSRAYDLFVGNLQSGRR